MLDRHGEESRYSPFRDLHNRKLLWHGSRTSNFAGIISQGLRIAPPEAPVVRKWLFKTSLNCSYTFCLVRISIVTSRWLCFVHIDTDVK